jgi:hypothetical protein
MRNAVPLEVIAAPFTMWVAPVGTAFPDVDQDPDSTDWTLMGAAGPLNYDEAGINVEHAQSMAFWRSLGDAGSRKVFRSSEDLKIGLMLVDVTPEQYSFALNGNTVTTTPAAPGVPGTKKIGLSRGFTVDTRAVLLRGPSPEMEDGVMQYECPRAAQTGEPKPVYTKDKPAMLAIEWTALVDPDAADPSEYFGRIVVQTAEAES